MSIHSSGMAQSKAVDLTPNKIIEDAWLDYLAGKIDSAFRKTIETGNTTLNDIDRFRVNVINGDYYYNRFDYDSSLLYFPELYDIKLHSVTSGILDYKVAASLIYKRAYLDATNEDYSKAIKEFKLAENIYTWLNNIDSVLECKIRISRIYVDFNKADSAILIINDAINLAKSNNNLKRLGEALADKSHHYTALYENDTVLQRSGFNMAEEALNIGINIKDTTLILSALQSLWSHMTIDKEIFYSEFTDDFCRSSLPNKQFHLLYLMICVYRINQQNTAEAKDALIKAKLYAKLPGVSKQAQISLLTCEVNLLIKENKYETALELNQKLDSLLSNDNPEKMYNNQYYIIRQMTELYIKIGNKEKANLYFWKTFDLMDKAFSEQKNRFFAESEIKYKTLEKEKELLIKEEKLHNAEDINFIQKRNLYLATALSSMLAAAMLLLVFQYNKKRKLNSLLFKQKVQLELSDEKKALLIREIHHRVKNNLQLISSLLELQSYEIEDKSALAALNEGRNRIKSIALIHQKLYNNEEFAYLNMINYCKELTQQVNSIYLTHNSIEINYKIEPIELDIDTAVPIGIILNELVTNIFKYAFESSVSENRKIISISLSNRNEGEFLLTVSDNGVGLPVDFETRKENSLGMRLVYRLTKQLFGKVMYESKSGTTFNILFYNTMARKKMEI